MSIQTPIRGWMYWLLAAAVVMALAACSGGGSGSGAALPTAPQPPADDGSGAAGGQSGGGGGGSQPGGGGGGGLPAPAGSGTLRLLLTDNPIDEIAELWVYIAELKVKRSGSPVERFPSSIGAVDLLTLQNGVTELLGLDQVEAGTYQFIELLLDEGQSFVVDLDGEIHDLKIPSQKVKVAGGAFDVDADGLTSVTIDFDAERSLKKTGNGRYQLKPFVTIAQVSQAAA